MRLFIGLGLAVGGFLMAALVLVPALAWLRVPAQIGAPVVWVLLALVTPGLPWLCMRVR